MGEGLDACRLVLTRLREAYGDDLERVLAAAPRSWRLPRAAIPALAQATREALLDLANRIAEPQDDESALATLDGVLWLDVELARLLRDRYGAEGSDAAETICKQRVLESATPRAFEAWSLLTDKPRVRVLAHVVWTALRGSWSEINARASEAEKKNVRMPRQVTSTVTYGLAHGGGELRGETIYVHAPRFCTMELFGASRIVRRGKTKLVGLSRALPPRTLRTWVVSLRLLVDANFPPDGVIALRSPERSILEIIGARKTLDPQNGRLYERFHSNARAGIRDDLWKLANTRVQIAGRYASFGAEPLVNVHFEIPRPNSSAPLTSAKGASSFPATVWLVHAPLVTRLVRDDYLQIPRAVCSLDAELVPFAIGIGSVARALVDADAVRRRSAIVAPIRAWLDAAGVDVGEELRREGATRFWNEMREQLERAAAEGAIGSFVASGDGAAMMGALTLGEELCDGYVKLIEARERNERLKRGRLRATRRSEER